MMMMNSCINTGKKKNQINKIVNNGLQFPASINNLNKPYNKTRALIC